MSTLSFNVKLTESNNVIAQNMLKALLPEINKYFNDIYQNMKQNISNIVVNYIKAQPEYESLISGKLKAEFGLPDATSRINSILSAIESGAMVQTKPLSATGGKLRGSIKLQMIQKDFSDLLSLGDSSFTTEKGSNLEWLRWLLIEGDNIIISEYYFIAGPYSTSRTGMGIMHGFQGGSWRVPPEYAGNVNNNWITRAIDAASSDIQKELESLARI
jgi:hypothetical protein